MVDGVLDVRGGPAGANVGGAGWPSLGVSVVSTTPRLPLGVSGVSTTPRLPLVLVLVVVVLPGDVRGLQGASATG